MSLHMGHIIWILNQPVVALTPWCCVIRREAANTNLIVFGVIRPNVCTHGEYANHYITDEISHSDLYWKTIIYNWYYKTVPVLLQ